MNDNTRNALSKTYNSLLQLAASQRDVELARKVLRKGGDAQAVFEIAFEAREHDLMKEALSRGASIDHLRAVAGTYLMTAVRRADDKLVAFLLEQGADTERRFGNKTALDLLLETMNEQGARTQVPARQRILEMLFDRLPPLDDDAAAQARTKSPATVEAPQIRKKPAR